MTKKGYQKFWRMKRNYFGKNFPRLNYSEKNGEI